jgi:hypothetical protein
MSVCEQHARLEEDIKYIKNKLDGNGRPGVLERLSRLETKLTIIIWLNGFMASAVIGSIIKSIIGG